jgi:hypothetical protein
VSTIPPLSLAVGPAPDYNSHPIASRLPLDPLRYGRKRSDLPKHKLQHIELSAFSTLEPSAFAFSFQLVWLVFLLTADS